MSQDLSDPEVRLAAFPAPGDDWVGDLASGRLKSRMRESGLVSAEVETTFEDRSGLGIGELNRVFLGFDGYEQAWSVWLADWESWTSDPVDFADHGDKVMIDIDAKARSKSAGIEMDFQVAVVYTIRDNLITRIEHHADRETARRSLSS